MSIYFPIFIRTEGCGVTYLHKIKFSQVHMAKICLYKDYNGNIIAIFISCKISKQEQTETLL